MTDADYREVLEYDGASGAIRRWYAYGLGPNDVLGQMNVPPNTRTTYVPDLLGSVVATMNAGTGTLSRSGYRPYGASASPATPFGFTGQRLDVEAGGLYYFRARAYRQRLRAAVLALRCAVHCAPPRGRQSPRVTSRKGSLREQRAQSRRRSRQPHSDEVQGPLWLRR